MKKTLSVTVLAFLILSGCVEVNLDEPKHTTSSSQSSASVVKTSEFRGTKGDFVALVDDQITLQAEKVDDGKGHAQRSMNPQYLKKGYPDFQRH